MTWGNPRGLSRLHLAKLVFGLLGGRVTGLWSLVMLVVLVVEPGGDVASGQPADDLIPQNRRLIDRGHSDFTTTRSR